MGKNKNNEVGLDQKQWTLPFFTAVITEYMQEMTPLFLK